MNEPHAVATGPDASPSPHASPTIAVVEELSASLSEAGGNLERARTREPIGAYVALAGVFIGVTALTLGRLVRANRQLPAPNALDVTLLALGTARLSRLITRDKVMRPLRAPFTAKAGPAGEAREQAAGSGLVRAVGELVTCPRCMAMWSASALSLTYAASPSSGRFAGLVLSSSLLSDLANRGLALLDEVKPAALPTPAP